MRTVNHRHSTLLTVRQLNVNVMAMTHVGSTDIL